MSVIDKKEFTNLGLISFLQTCSADCGNLFGNLKWMFQESKHGNAPHKFERDASIPVWSGWYGLRRGAGTVATAVEGQLAAKTLLRHRNIATTQQYYISSVDATAVRAVDKISALFDNRVASERPS